MAVFAFVGACLPPPAQAATLVSSDLFSDGFEQGLSAWKVQAAPGRAVPTRRFFAKGRQAARFEVRPGELEPRTRSQRAELYLDAPLFDAGQTLYVRDSIRLDPGFVATGHYRSWRIVQQLHEVGISRPPGLAVFVDPGLRLGLRSGTGSPDFWRGPKLDRGRWYKLLYAVHLSSDRSRGWVRVWLDGQPQLLTNASTEMHGATIHARKAFLKVGLYRSRYFSDTSIVYHDDVAVTRSSTDPFAAPGG